MMRISCLGASLLLVFSLIGLPASTGRAGAEQQRIAAVVNDEVISVHDVDTRLALVIGSSGFPNTPDVRSKLLPQIIQQLVDEKLKLQQAKLLKLTVTDADINSALAYVEKQNNLPPGGFEKVLASRGLDRASAIEQLRADVAWIKVVQSSVMSSIRIGDGEVDMELNRMKANQGRPERLVSEIYLPIDNPNREMEILHLGERLSEQLRAGADFKSVARQFSQSPTAAVGGNMDWVTEGQLEEELERALDVLKIGEVSGPIKTLSGYYILKLSSKRQSADSDPEDENITLSQIYMPTAGKDAMKPGIRSDMRALIKQNSHSCSDINSFAKEMKTPQSGPLGTIKAKDLPAEIRKTVLALPLNTPSEPVITKNAEIILMVCERITQSNLPSREQITKRLESQRLDILSKRHLRDVRREAFLDIRI